MKVLRTERRWDPVWPECNAPMAWGRDRRTRASHCLRGRRPNHTGTDASGGNWQRPRGSWTGICGRKIYMRVFIHSIIASLFSKLSHIHNKAIRDDKASLAMIHARFHHNARLTSWRTLMAYFVLSCNGEEYLINYWVQNRIPIWIVLEDDRVTGIILLV